MDPGEDGVNGQMELGGGRMGGVNVRGWLTTKGCRLLNLIRKQVDEWKREGEWKDGNNRGLRMLSAWWIGRWNKMRKGLETGLRGGREVCVLKEGCV